MNLYRLRLTRSFGAQVYVAAQDRREALEHAEDSEPFRQLASLGRPEGETVLIESLGTIRGSEIAPGVVHVRCLGPVREITVMDVSSEPARTVAAKLVGAVRAPQADGAGEAKGWRNDADL